MATGRATQAGAAAFGRGAGGRITQAGVLAFGRAEPTNRVTQAGVVVFGRAEPTMRITQAGAAVFALPAVPCVTQWATCWIIRRLDGGVLGFTDLDSPLTLRGVTCSPCDSLNGSALELASPLGSVGNQDVTGLIDDDAISEADLHAGKYDGATVEIWLVAWIADPARPYRATLDPVRPPSRQARGTMGRVSRGDVTFRAEVLTDGAALEQKPLTRIYTPGCTWQQRGGQYGPECGLVRADHLVTSAVTGVAARSVHNAARHRAFFDSGRAEPSGTFDRAQLTWLTGANAGLRSEVKAWDLDQKRFVLWDALPAEIAPGDTYETAPNCGYSPEGCKGFGNFINFGGFDKVPGQDAIVQTPDYKG